MRKWKPQTNYIILPMGSASEGDTIYNLSEMRTSASESWSCLCQKIHRLVFIIGTKCKIWFLTHFSTHIICLNLFSIKFCGIYYSPECFPGSTSGKEPTCQCRRLRDVDWSLGLEDSLEEGMATHSSILDWRSPWSLTGYSPQGHEESDTTEVT